MRKQTVADPGLLYFGNPNAKLRLPNIRTFSIPAGHTCPGAKDCQSRFDRGKRKIVDGPHTQFRCFAASTEAARTSVRLSTDRNWELLKRAQTLEVMQALIQKSLPPPYFDIIRVHVHGDFFSMDYLLAWLETARKTPDRLFYAYTKSLHLLSRVPSLIPENFVFTASRGGKYDHLIEKHGFREAIVVNHPEEAEALGLPIDHDDSLARDPSVRAYTLLLHNTQPKGSKAALAKARMLRENIKFAYGK